MISVMLVDDQDLVRAGLRGILRPELGFQIIAECGDGTEVIAAIARARPDIVLMDVRMPTMDGVTAAEQVNHTVDPPPILALTTFDDDHALAGMLRAGVAGFVLKGVPAVELQRAVRSVADGGAWLDPAVTARVLTVYRGAPPPPSVDDPAMNTLTTREREVLALIARGLTNAEIAQEFTLGEGTVKTHVNHIFTKLRLRDRAAAVIYAYDHRVSL
jgi:DNA-binding NarL/FixJ family response regulator